jgi:hypothetical protein
MYQLHKNKTYRQLYNKGNPRSEHRIVMEKHLGRLLTSDEIIHHIDGNKRNNDISNLLITNRSEHIKMHPEIGNKSKFKNKYSYDRDLIIEMYCGKGMTTRQIGRELNIPRNSIMVWIFKNKIKRS